MAYNVLVADDSLTIQKVVSITLSNGDFKLVESLNESDLVAKASSQTFDLILVDFNLSESKSGYDLCKEVHKLAPQTPIMAMLGTFDTVDDSSLRDAGILDKIVKPFESEKFIAKCTALINSGGSQAESSSEESLEQSWSESGEDDQQEQVEEQEDFGDQWVVEGKSQPEQDSSFEYQEFDEDDSSELDQEQSLETKLQSELEGWGIRVPGVIGKEAQNQSSGTMPPRISETAAALEQDDDQDDLDNVISFSDSQENSQEDSQEEVQEDIAVPNQDDLAYPDLELSEADEPKSKLISVEELNNEVDDDNWDDDKTDPVINLGAIDESQSDYQNEIQKEIEEDLSPDDFWAVDDSQDHSQDDSQAENQDESSVDFNDDTPTDFDDHQSVQAHSNSFSGELSDDQIDQIAERLKEKISPLIASMVDELAKKYCQQSIDKVAWEVIPDLAENLIRKEIQDISQSVKNH